MKKGSFKKQKKFLSVVLVPHSSDNVKVLKFSAFYSKLAVIFAVVFLLLVFTGGFITYTIYQNIQLRSDLSRLKEDNLKQSELISEKSSEIDMLKQREDSMNGKIKDFMDKYKEVANQLLNRSGDVRSSRSGDRSEKSVVKDINDLKAILNSLSEESNSQNEELSALKATESKLEKYMESIPTLRPTEGRISSNYGGRRDPFQNRKKFHEGIDFAADYGQNIKAAAAGKVVFSDYTGGYGYNVIIDHGNNLSTLYGHCSRLLVKEGQTVKKGDVIAKVGSSGRSTGSHLHYEVRISGEQVDPMKYLE
ncbi:MAG: peptidoglycan DD-metalloendopeptidase family protein [Clostridia bacterium]|nr:peptidoglycan DD-metalloendopeptidase family protein [Clostridia bacterium]